MIFFSARGYPWLMFSLLSTNTPWAFSEQLLPNHTDTLSPSLNQCKELVYLWCRTRHLSLLNFMRFVLAHSFSMQRSSWRAALPTSILIVPQPALMCKSTEQSSLCHLLQVIVNDVKQDVFQDRPTWCSTCYSCYCPHGPLAWPSNPSGCPVIQTETSELGQKGIVRPSVRNPGVVC